MTAPSEPPRNRSVATALRSALVLGVACTLFGLVFVVAFGILNRFPRFRPYFIAMGVLLWLGPGVLYLICAALIRRHRHGAATAGLATTAFQGLGAATMLVLSVTVQPVSPLPVLLCVMWLVALGDCARHLVRARRFLESGTERTKGFEVMSPPKRVLPMPDER